jgi:hypothetical protein
MDLPLHSTGIIVTDLQTEDQPDLHSFKLGTVKGQLAVVKGRGWGHSGRVPTPTKNPPEGFAHTLYAPLDDGLSPEAMNVIHELLLDHKELYGECRIYLTDNHRQEAALRRWVSTGCLPGTDAWDTDTDPTTVELPDVEIPV